MSKVLFTAGAFFGLFFFCLAMFSAEKPLRYNKEKTDVESIKESAEKGSAYHQGLLSEFYRRGEFGLGKNYTEAFKLAELSAKKSHPIGMYNLAVLYEEGKGTSKNQSRAEQLYRALFSSLKNLADKNDKYAQYDIGFMYYAGKSVQKNPQEALKYISLAAEKGHMPASYLLGKMYLHGEGVEKDPGKAVFWLAKSASKGDIMSEYLLGITYLKGDGTVGKNSGEAYFWLSRAAKKGDADAQFFTGLLLENGDGIDKSPTEAEEWYRKAAEQNHAGAIKKLKKRPE